MTGRVDADVRADEAIGTDGDRCFVEYGEVEVGKEPLAHTDLLAVVAVEGLDNQNLVKSMVPLTVIISRFVIYTNLQT